MDVSNLLCTFVRDYRLSTLCVIDELYEDSVFSYNTQLILLIVALSYSGIVRSHLSASSLLLGSESLLCISCLLITCSTKAIDNAVSWPDCTLLGKLYQFVEEAQKYLAIAEQLSPSGAVLIGGARAWSRRCELCIEKPKIMVYLHWGE